MERGIGLFTIGFILVLGFNIFISSCQKEDPPIMEATSMQLVSGGNQTSDAESTLASPVEVLVKDQEGNVFQGAKVNFAVTEGSVSSGTATTDAGGKAKTTWTLGSTAGTQTLTATAYKANGTTSLSGSPIAVSATANELIEATSIDLVSGGNQSGDVESRLVDPIKILVRDQNGNTFQGATVKFSVAEGAVSSASEITDANGNASVSWTLGSTAGAQSLTVSAFKADGTTALTGSPLTVTATTNPLLEATSIELVSGGDQSGYGGTELENHVVVLVKDQNGDVLIGATVNYAVSEGAVSSASETTVANGTASVAWTLGATEGTQTLTITAFKSDGTTPLTGSPLLVNATANAIPEATSIMLTSGGDQTGYVNSNVGNPIEVLVKDQNGNSFQGATVNFEVIEGSVSSASEITDANGTTSITWKLGATEGTQTLTITAFQADGTTPLTGSPLQVNATGTLPGTSGEVTDYDGNVYQTVQIGNQVWMAENLKVTHYPDGTEIPLVTNNTSWGNLADNDTKKAYCFYNNDENSLYGALYTSAAAMNGNASTRENPSGIQGVCPDNWHLPSDLEWYELRSYLGIATAAGQMKTTGTLQDGTGLWNTPNTGATNESGFSALPGGDRRPDNGTFRNLGYGGAWLTTYHTSATDVKVMNITYLNEDIKAFNLPKSGAYSVRCVKD